MKRLNDVVDNEVVNNEVCKFKGNNKNVNFPKQFCLGSISNKFDSVEAEEVSLKVNVYDFSVDYDTIDKYDILNIDMTY